MFFFWVYFYRKFQTLNSDLQFKKKAQNMKNMKHEWDFCTIISECEASIDVFSLLVAVTTEVIKSI